MRLRLDLGYDGTAFHGWAAQPGLRTVQQTLEDAIAIICGQPEPRLRLTVAGRTDAGVHARGQVAHLDVPEPLASRLTAGRMNGVLKRSVRAGGIDGPGGFTQQPVPDVIVFDVREAPDGFDARFSAISRRYEYRLRPAGAKPDPLTARFTAEVPRELDLAAMRRASDAMLGLRDFTTFCKAREGSTAVRDLLRFDWRECADGALAATIEADAFCHSMVRALVGAVVAAGHGRIGLAELVELRDARERTSRFTVMPAHGLSLEGISYPPDAELAARAEQTRARRDPLSAAEPE